ncbi:MAG: peptidase [Gammaproteobacteria bacterium]|nr:peptidase [Gammaproteobacteria bacterium]
MPGARIQIFKAGTHVTAAGDALTFSAADLSRTAAAYDPALSQAPIVVGHPKLDAPAYGWVKELTFTDTLNAEPDQVEPQFAELVRAGRFKKVSAAFYPPQHPRNPVPGVYYLRHVGFLGAQAPAVKGLRDASFADDETGVVEIEFSNSDAWNVARVFRSLREWLLTKFSTEDADRVVPDYVIQELDAAARDETMTADLPAPMYSERGSTATPTPDQESAMTAEEKAALAAREAAIAAKETEFSEREAAIQAREEKARRTDAVEFAEQLVTDGKLLPLDKAALVEFMVDAPEIEFTEGSATVKKPREAWFRAWLARLPKQVEFKELTRLAEAGATVEFAAPPGWSVDQGRLALHRAALAYQHAHPAVGYADAIKAVR